MNTSLDRFIKSMERSKLDKLEEKRESKKQATRVKPVEKGQIKMGKDFFMPLLGGAGLAAMFTPITAGIAALSASLVGLRGWEVGAIKKIDNLAGISKAFSQGFINLRAAWFAKLGLNATLGAADADGKRTLKTPLMAQLNNGMSNWFKGLQQKWYSAFGLGVDGKPVIRRGADGKFVKGTALMARLGVQINSLLRPIINLSAGIGKWFTGAGAKIVAWSTKFIGAGGSKLLGVLGKILYPIGILISAFKGVTDFMDTEGTLYEKFTAGLSTFLSDFIGQPLNLLKDIVAWVIGKMGFDETSQSIKDFDIAKVLKVLITSILEFPNKAVAWISDKFTATIDYLNPESNKVTAGIATLLTDIFTFPTKALSWIIEKFSFEDGVLSGLWNGLLATLNLTKNLYDIPFSLAKQGVEWVAGLFGWALPKDFTLNPMDSVINFMSEVGTWLKDLLPDISTIGAKMKAALIESLSPRVASFLGLGPTKEGIKESAKKGFNDLDGQSGAIFKVDQSILNAMSAHGEAQRAKLTNESITILRDMMSDNFAKAMQKSTAPVIINNVDNSQKTSGTVVQTTPPVVPFNASVMKYRGGAKGYNRN